METPIQQARYKLYEVEENLAAAERWLEHQLDQRAEIQHMVPHLRDLVELRKREVSEQALRLHTIVLDELLEIQ